MSNSPTSADKRSILPDAQQRVLIADDNRDAADALALLLSDAGQCVLVAYSGPNALVLADELQPDVMIADIGMPELNGFELARRVRSRHWSRGTALIAMTGWATAGDVQRSREAGFDVLLTKPIDGLTLEAAIERELCARRL